MIDYSNKILNMFLFNSIYDNYSKYIRNGIMERYKFLERLSELKLSVFSLHDAIVVLEKSNAYTSLYLNRLKRAGAITQIQRGTYALNTATFVEIATSIIKPSYMTMLSALYYHGLINQMQNVITIFNTRKSGNISITSNDGSYNIKFVKVKPSILFGYKRYEGKQAYAYVAEPEKALVDMLYMPTLCPLSYAADLIKDRVIKEEKLIEYAKRTGSQITVRRLDSLLAETGYDKYKEVEGYDINTHKRLNPNNKGRRRIHS